MFSQRQEVNFIATNLIKRLLKEMFSQKANDLHKKVTEWCLQTDALHIFCNV